MVRVPIASLSRSTPRPADGPAPASAPRTPAPTDADGPPAGWSRLVEAPATRPTPSGTPGGLLALRAAALRTPQPSVEPLPGPDLRPTTLVEPHQRPRLEDGALVLHLDASRRAQQLELRVPIASLDLAPLGVETFLGSIRSVRLPEPWAHDPEAPIEMSREGESLVFRSDSVTPGAFRVAPFLRLETEAGQMLTIEPRVARVAIDTHADRLRHHGQTLEARRAMVAHWTAAVATHEAALAAPGPTPAEQSELARAEAGLTSARTRRDEARAAAAAAFASADETTQAHALVLFAGRSEAADPLAALATDAGDAQKAVAVLRSEQARLQGLRPSYEAALPATAVDRLATELTEVEARLGVALERRTAAVESARIAFEGAGRTPELWATAELLLRPPGSTPRLFELERALTGAERRLDWTRARQSDAVEARTERHTRGLAEARTALAEARTTLSAAEAPPAPTPLRWLPTVE
jgi:hypothetical protein